MSGGLPQSVDAWRMVSARRSFAGQVPVAALRRLCGVLAGDTGRVEYTLDFGREEVGVPAVRVRADAVLQLVCQRTLEPFGLPLRVDTWLGLIRDERDEAGLPAGCEPLLLPADGRLHPADVIEDELLLALPLVPINPDSSLPDVASSTVDAAPAEDASDSPFAVLRKLKR